MLAKALELHASYPFRRLASRAWLSFPALVHVWVRSSNVPCVWVDFTGSLVIVTEAFHLLAGTIPFVIEWAMMFRTLEPCMNLRCGRHL